MKLQTKIPIRKQLHHQIDYSSKVFLVGSCFSEHIGSKFEYYKFHNLINPFGILFHPLAIENLVARAINQDFYNDHEILEFNDIFFSYDAHSRLNALNADEVKLNLNRGLEQTLQFLEEASHVIITLGSSWVYRHIDTDKIVANCHKVPQKQFLKDLLSVDAIAESLEATMALIKSINSRAAFILTVSPVRHLKDGFVENNRSKAHLLSAIHQVVEPRQNIYYFPSYEIVMDELRDYRFYAEDLIHPNNIAVDYIWCQFFNYWLSGDSCEIIDVISDIQKGLLHRPFNPHSESHKLFLVAMDKKIKTITAKFPHISF